MSTGKTKKTILKYALSIVFLIALIIVTAIMITKEASLTEIISAIRQADLKWLSLAALMPILYLIFQSFSTRELAKKIEANASFIDHVSYTAADYYFSAITPSATGGQPVVMYYMAKDGIGIAKSSMMLIINTAMYKLILVSLGLFCLITSHNLISESSPLFQVLFVFGIVFNILIVVVLFLMTFKENILRKICLFFISLLSKMKIMRKKQKWIDILEFRIKEYRQGKEFIKKNKLVFLKCFALNLIQRVCLFSISYFVYRSFGFKGRNYFDLFAVQTFIAVSVDSLPLPGGVGASEAFMATMFKRFYTESKVVPGMVLTRLVSYYFLVLIVGIIVIIKHISCIIRDKKRKNELELMS